MSLRLTVVGGGTVGRALSVRLAQRGDTVRIIELDEETAEQIREPDVEVVVGDGTDTDLLADVGIERDDVFLAATGDDDVNLLATQLASSQFGVERVVARVNNVENREAFQETGVEAVATTEATAIQLDNYIERPSLTDWIDKLGGEAREIEIADETVDGWTVAELDEYLPEQVLVVSVTHEDVAEFPDPTDTVAVGDRVTLLGERDAVDEALRKLTADEVPAGERC